VAGSRPFSDLKLVLPNDTTPFLAYPDPKSPHRMFFSRLAWGRFLGLYDLNTTFLKTVIRRGTRQNELGRKVGLNYCENLLNELIREKHGAHLDGDMQMYLYRHSFTGGEKHTDWTIREMGLEALHRVPMTAVEFDDLNQQIPTEWLHAYRLSDYAHTYRYRDEAERFGADVSYVLGTKKLHYKAVYYYDGMPISTDVTEHSNEYDPEHVHMHVESHIRHIRDSETDTPDYNREWKSLEEMAAQFVRACKARRLNHEYRASVIENLWGMDPNFDSMARAVRPTLEKINRPDQTGRLERVLYDLGVNKLKLTSRENGANPSIALHVLDPDREEAARHLAEPTEVMPEVPGSRSLGAVESVDSVAGESVTAPQPAEE